MADVVSRRQLVAGPVEEQIFGVAWHRIREIAFVVDRRDFLWLASYQGDSLWLVLWRERFASETELGRNRSLVAWESDLSDVGRNRSLELPGDLAWEGTDLWSCLVTPGAPGVATASINAETRFVVGIVSRR